MPPGWAAFLKRSNKSQRLENWGARRAAFRPYFFLSPKGWPFGDPGGDWTCSAEVNSACAKEDSAPPCPRHLARPIGDGAPGEKEENAARLGGIFEA